MSGNELLILSSLCCRCTRNMGVKKKLFFCRSVKKHLIEITKLALRKAAVDECLVNAVVAMRVGAQSKRS